MGPSGSGKSTLLNIIGGVIKPQHGIVNLNGHDLIKLSASQRDHLRADCIGYVFQQFNLVPYLNAIENVLLPCQFSSIRRKKAAKITGTCRDEAHKLLQEFFTNASPDFSKPVSHLSVGQQQRVAAARALIGNPELIIADEPTSALDHNARQLFMKQLLQQAKNHGSTLLFVSHDPTLQTHFKSIVEMQNINHIAG